MAKTSVRVEPIGRGDVRNRGGHNSRKGSKAAHIDETRTCFNMTLYGGDDAVEDIYMDIEGVDNQRAGGPVCAEIVSSFPLELIGEKEGQKLTPEICSRCLASPVFQTWVDATIEGMRRHGLIHADLHMDEDTPHIQAFLSIKTERKVGKRDRSGKSKTVLNYAHFWSIEGDKKTKDFYFAAGKVSDNPKKLARVEEKYGMKYDPSITPTGKLQTEFAELYQSAGLDMKRGESVLTTGVRHKSFHKKRAEDERKAVEAEIAEKNAKLLAEYKIQAEAKLAQDKAEIDKTTEQAKAKADEDKAQAEAKAREAEQARIKAEADLAAQVASAAAAARARAKADEDKAQAEKTAKEAEQAKAKAEEEAQKEGREVAAAVAWLEEAYTQGVEQVSQQLEAIREQQKKAEQDLEKVRALADEIAEEAKKQKEEKDKAEAKAKEAEQARVKAEEEAQKEGREVAAAVAWLEEAYSQGVEQLSQRLEQVREQNKRAENDLSQAQTFADEAKQTLEKTKEERNNAKVALEQAQEEAKKVKAQAESDVTAVKTYYESLKSLGKTLLGLTDVAGGVVEYLKQMRERADAKFRSAIWRRAQELRCALAQAVRATEAHEQVDEDYNDAATRLKLE